MQTNYGRQRPTVHDDINDLYQTIPQYFPRIKAIRDAIEASPGMGLLEASQFELVVRNAVEHDIGGYFPKEVLEAAKRLVRIGLDKLAEETPLSR